jgi:hypothetical protein
VEKRKSVSVQEASKMLTRFIADHKGRAEKIDSPTVVSDDALQQLEMVVDAIQPSKKRKSSQ